MLSFVPNCFPDETGTRRLSKSSFDYRAQGQLRAHQHAGLDRRGVVHGSNIYKTFNFICLIYFELDLYHISVALEIFDLV